MSEESRHAEIEPFAVGGATFGDGRLAIIAGPCVVESREQALQEVELARGARQAASIGYEGNAAVEFPELYDLGFRPDIDSPGGVVENKQPRFGCQPSGQQNLLLISATEIPDYLLSSWRLYIKGLNEAVGELFLFRNR